MKCTSSRNVARGNSLVVQWLGLTISLPRALVQSLVGELKSHKSQSVTKIKCSQQCFCDSAANLRTCGHAHLV